MPRIIYVLIFLVFTVTPIIGIWVAQEVMGVSTAKQATTTTDPNTGYHNNNYHSHYYHRPYYGGFFYYGNRGRGGWLGRSYRSYGGSYSSSSSRSGYGSRSYSGGRSSYSGGSFGSFGK